MLKNPKNASTRSASTEKSPIISTGSPFVLRLSKDERRFFSRIKGKPSSLGTRHSTRFVFDHLRLFESFDIAQDRFQFRASNFISLESWKPGLFLQKSIVLYFNCDRYKLSIGNKLRPVDIAAVDHGESGLNAGYDYSTWIPTLAIVQGIARIYILKKVKNALYAGFDILQRRLLFSELMQGKAKVQPADAVTLVLGERFLQSLTRLCVIAGEVLGLAQIA